MAEILIATYHINKNKIKNYFGKCSLFCQPHLLTIAADNFQLRQMDILKFLLVFFLLHI